MPDDVFAPIPPERFDDTIRNQTKVQRDNDLLLRRIARYGVAAGVAGGVFGLFGMGLAWQVNNKPAPAPVVWMVDRNGGPAERLYEAAITIEPSEAADRYWLNKYVIACERYRLTILQEDYDNCALMSEGNVREKYLAQFRGPDALHEKYGHSLDITVSITSIHPRRTDEKEGRATVRFTTQKVYRNNTKEPPQHRIATVAYRYDDGAMSETTVRMNYTGFRVVDYVVDSETVGG